MTFNMLIVDDSQLEREVLQNFFEASYNIYEAADGRQALDIIDESPCRFDIILLDLIMPVMDGREFLRIRAKSPHLLEIPVVIITASDNVEDQKLAFDLGATDYITKPFIPEIAQARVRNVIESQRRFKNIEAEAASLRIKSETDLLTGLYNKGTAQALIEAELTAHAHRTHALMIVDVDNFKNVNDTEGHLVGDHTLTIIANQISAQFRRTDIVGRFGGDEFIICMVNIPNRQIARRKANELALLLKYKPNLTLPANVSVSVGLAFSDGVEKAAELFNMADRALYEAKSRGKAQMAEYGQARMDPSNDDRKPVLLVSDNRIVCSHILSYMGQAHRVVEINSPEALMRVPRETWRDALLTYADISGTGDNGEEMWKLLADAPKPDDMPVIAVVSESNLPQYEAAIENGAADIVSTPIDAGQLQRRTTRYIKNEN